MSTQNICSKKKYLQTTSLPSSLATLVYIWVTNVYILHRLPLLIMLSFFFFFFFFCYRFIVVLSSLMNDLIKD